MQNVSFAIGSIDYNNLKPRKNKRFIKHRNHFDAAGLQKSTASIPAVAGSAIAGPVVLAAACASSHQSTASIPAVAGPLIDWPVRFFSSWKLEVLYIPGEATYCSRYSGSENTGKEVLYPGGTTALMSDGEFSTTWRG